MKSMIFLWGRRSNRNGLIPINVTNWKKDRAILEVGFGRQSTYILGPDLSTFWYLLSVYCEWEQKG